MRFFSTAAALAGLALAGGCHLFGDKCDGFMKDPQKYDFYRENDEKPTSKETGPFVIAAYAKGSDSALIREALETALKEAGGGSVGDLKDEGNNYKNFGRSVPYQGELIPLSFETKLRVKELNTDEPLELVWKGTPSERTMELNKLADGKPVAGYPTIVPVGDKFRLKVPLTYIGDGKKTLIAVTKLTERDTGGFKFKAAPFALRSKAKAGAKDAEVEWNGDDDQIKLDTDAAQLLLYTVSGYKGDPREFQCKLMSHEVKTQKGLVTFDLALASMWFKVTGHTEEAFKVFTASGEISGESGSVTGIEAKLPSGYPSPGKKYETREALNTTKEPKEGDYVYETSSDEQAGKVKYALHIRIPVVKDKGDPDQVEFKVTVKQPNGNKEYNQKWLAGK